MVAQLKTFDAHGTPASREDDHYTPAYIWQLALEYMGVDKFALDPASNSHSNPNIPAEVHYTIAEDGLSKTWDATTVWLNPPYSSTKLWVDKLITEYMNWRTQQAVLLVKGDFSTKWFQPLLNYPICLVNHRVKFINPKNNGNTAKYSSVLVAIGGDSTKFYKTFDVRHNPQGLGTVVMSINPK